MGMKASLSVAGAVIGDLRLFGGIAGRLQNRWATFQTAKFPVSIVDYQSLRFGFASARIRVFDNCMSNVDTSSSLSSLPHAFHHARPKIRSRSPASLARPHQPPPVSSTRRERPPRSSAAPKDPTIPRVCVCATMNTEISSQRSDDGLIYLSYPSSDVWVPP